MEENPFIPEQIWLLTDWMLERTTVEYRGILTDLGIEDFESALRMRTQVEEALHSIETELSTRRGRSLSGEQSPEIEA